MEIILDYRERGLISEFDKLKIAYQSKNLLVGDIQILNDGVVIYIIERKTAADYIASIKDHRLKNQMARVKSFQVENPQAKFIILVEGGFQETFGQPFQISDFIYNSILHRLLQDGIPVIRSDNLHESVVWIQKLITVSRPIVTSMGGTNDYLQTIAVKKKDNMTPENCYLLQLTHIPGVSLTIAKVISQTYPSWASLINYYQSLSPKVATLALAKLPVGTKRLGKVLSGKIYHYLFPPKKVRICLRWKKC